jgi:drug/metabolite transporter (DMT)-like permease
MYTVVAYVLLVLIWSSTPLAIQFSSETLSFLAAYVVRVALAALLFLPIYCCLPGKLSLLWSHRRMLFIGSLTIFPYLPLTYWSSQYLPSGMMSILMATAPLLFAVMTWCLSKKNPFTPKTALGFLIGMCGVACVSFTQLKLSTTALFGAMVLVGATAIYAFSAVKMHMLIPHRSINAFDRTAGAMVYASPGVLASWWWMGDVSLAALSFTEHVALLYLAVFGSIFAGLFYFIILKKWSAMSVSLITLQTPILALLLGYWIKDETLTPLSAFGSVLVLLGVMIYLPWNVSRLRQWLKKSHAERVINNEANTQTEHHEIKEKMHRYR